MKAKHIIRSLNERPEEWRIEDQLLVHDSGVGIRWAETAGYYNRLVIGGREFRVVGWADCRLRNAVLRWIDLQVAFSETVTKSC